MNERIWSKGRVEDMTVVSDVPVPVPSAKEVLVEVTATAINRADTLQRMGKVLLSFLFILSVFPVFSLHLPNV